MRMRIHTHHQINRPALLLVGIILGTVVGCHESKEKKETDMAERTGLVTMKGSPLTLVGNEVKIGQKAPEAELVANDLSVVKLSSLCRGKVCIITAVPSLDTAVCDLETRRFNEEAGKLGEDVVILTVSMDLPFAQKRWCGAAGVQKRSDALRLSGGRLRQSLWRADQGPAPPGPRRVRIGQTGHIRYVELVKEVASEPNYDAALAAAKKLL